MTGMRIVRRRAFSLVEMLVAMALIAFLMSILSAAFAAAAKTFSDLKAAGDLAERLRGTMTLLRRDLQAQHFGPTNRTLSSPNFWTNGPPQQGFIRIYQDAPATQWPPPALLGPTEIPTYTSTRSMLHFSVILPAKYPGDFFSTDVRNPLDPLVNTAAVPAFTTAFNQDQRYQPTGTSVFRSNNAEVIWWLSPSINPNGSPAMTEGDLTASPPLPPQPLFTLRRRQCLLWPESPVNRPNITLPPQAPSPASAYDEISAPGINPALPLPQTVKVNSSTEVTIPSKRFAMAPMSLAGLPAALVKVPPSANIYPKSRVEDIVVDWVLSFDVRILLFGDSTWVDLFDPRPFGSGGLTDYAIFNAGTAAAPNYLPNNPAYNFLNPLGPRVFDTWSSQGAYALWNTPNTSSNTNIPLFKKANGQTIQIQAIQVTLRLYDAKSQTTRQVTLVQTL